MKTTPTLPISFVPFLLLALACSAARPLTDPVDTSAASIVRAPPTGGFVSATVSSFQKGAPPLASIAATFWTSDAAGPGVLCHAKTVAQCIVRTCEPGPRSRPLEAGAITVQADGAPIASMAPDAGGRYANPAGKAALWSPGATLRFAAAGGSVPAFDATLTAPAALDVLEPTGEATLDRTAGFPVRWSAGATGSVRVAIRQQGVAGRTALEGGGSVDCFFDRAAGTAVVPPEALADLDGAAETHAMVYAVETSRLRAGEHDVLVLVNTAGLFVPAKVR